MASFSSESEGDNFEVDEILDVRKKGRVTEYLVKWKDYESEEESWEPARNLRHSTDAIKRFEARKANKKTPTKRKVVKDVQEESSSSTRGGRSVTKQTTTTVTRVESSRKGGFSSDSSPESSPIIRRRQVITTETSSSSPKKLGSSCPATFSLECLRCVDTPILILLACLIFIALTFVADHTVLAKGK